MLMFYITPNKKMLLQETHSSFTCGSIIDDETANTLRTALIINTSLLRGDFCVIRVDNASGFQALHNDQLLHSCGITLDFIFNMSKDSNSVIDKGIQELEHEILRIDQFGTAVSPLNLQLAIDSLNKRIRNRGVSAKEVLLPRDQYTNEEIPIDDIVLSKKQNVIRNQNHHASSRSKAPGKKLATNADVKVGDLVYLKAERQKNRLHDCYIITRNEKDNAYLQKLGNNFMSCQYEVPLNHVFPAIRSKTYHDWDEHKQYSGDDSSSEDNSIDGANSNDVQSDSESDTAIVL